MIGFLLGGRTTLRAGVWHGRHRFTPLAPASGWSSSRPSA